VERLFEVAQAAEQELTRQDVVPQLHALQAALEALANNPADTRQSQRATDARNKLQSQLSDAPSDSWAPADREVLERIGMADLMGNALLGRIESALTRNEVTTAGARDEMVQIYQEATNALDHLTRLTSALGYFKLQPADLEQGAEGLVTIPRAAVDNRLDTLGSEFVEIRSILAPFQELGTGTREDVEVHFISSTDFMVAVGLAPVVAYLWARAVNEILKVYINIQTIREQRSAMKDAGMTDEALEGVDRVANGMMSTRIAELAVELLDAQQEMIRDLRSNELETELKRALSKLADRIDRGYTVDFRTAELPEAAEAELDDEDATDEGPSDSVMLAEVRELARQIRYLPASGEPILALENGEGGE
jgi:hypothetical protein